MHEQKRELVQLFEDHGSLAEPALLEELASKSDGAVRVQALLGNLDEVPFHFDTTLFHRLEAKERDVVGQTRTPRPTERDLQRKEAMRQKAAAVYDSDVPPEEGLFADSDTVDADPDDVPEEENAHVPVRPPPRQPVVKILPRSDWRPEAAEFEGRLEVVSDMTGNSTCEGTTGDFVTYFRDRYEKISKILRQRRELRNASAVERVRGGQQDVRLIGMVAELTTTKNGHKMLELEDPSGSIRCLVNKNERQLLAFADTLVCDEVIGVVGQASEKGDMVFLTSLVRPDIPRPEPDRKVGADVPVSAAFLSDIHVGSNTFLEENWNKMLKWLAGHGDSKRERQLAGRIKYLVIPGDLVDGVGVYPGQQDELTIGDVYDQYEAFGEFMQSVPKHMELIVQPGNHDAARPAEPQPAFSQEVKSRFDHHEARFVANPATFSMHGVKTLGYHGSSLIDFATSVANLEYEKPLESMEQMLQSRHLSPLYGERTPVAPEHNDYLVIDAVPDLFITGHVHVPGIRNYRGVTMINSGTWQGQTLYQKMLNFTPDPAKMPLMDLQSMRGTLVDFSSPASSGEAA